ncbi:hypothetical protein BW730_12520 [Tessaracoccus aquimaris]|uniref:DUF1707 domain-containing protein n=1 Tax=Tessaracoccus aquimaris TaxID=1332264 RepID=A0A1Q2CQ22_9ACTN|nr:DUF1707 domain-containing protein [Tessaracoccus aquimaris]AQP48203.1 hypothetical protein BW730_12520 [Tessaracoccus aquimaris]
MDINNIDDQLRITSAQRESAVELVRQAAADGRLDFDEMNGRVSVGLEARTQGELRRIVGDLVPSAELAAFLADVTPPLEGPGSTWDDPLVIGRDSQWDVKGPWNVPPFLEVYCSFWKVLTLNFLEATALAPVIDMVVVAHSGSPTVIVPPGWGVDTERLSVNSQGAFTSNVATRPDKGMPRIVMRGHTRNGKARYATTRELRKLAERRALANPSMGPAALETS